MCTAKLFLWQKSISGIQEIKQCDAGSTSTAPEPWTARFFLCCSIGHMIFSSGDKERNIKW